MRRLHPRRWLAWSWRELWRPRGHVPHRFYRGGRGSRAGVALVVVLTTILFMTVLVTEIGYAASVRLTLAAHQRDEAKAEGLALTGVQIYRLILVASKQLGQNQFLANMAASYGVNIGDSLWQMIPFINTGLLRMILVSGDDLDEQERAQMESEGLTEEEIAESRESQGANRNFLDFDGDFFAQVSDEDQNINVAKISASTYAELMEDQASLQLYSLMSGVRTCGATLPFSEGVVEDDEKDDHDQFFYEINIDRWELIANLADWTDADNTRLYQGGNEDVLYQSLEHPYLPKNAPFDTLEEVRLVDGWHLDDVWERYGQHLTTYGAGKVNVNTAECEVLWALVKSYYPNAPDTQIEQIIRYIEEYRAMASFSNEQAFSSYLTQAWPNIDANVKNAVSTQSTVFRVQSTGQVGRATVKIETVLDFTQSGTGKVVYWRVE